jgi:hypothetical protein
MNPREAGRKKDLILPQYSPQAIRFVRFAG